MQILKQLPLRELEEEIGYTADLELFYDFILPLAFVMSESNFYGATNLKRWKIHVHKMRMRP